MVEGERVEDLNDTPERPGSYVLYWKRASFLRLSRRYGLAIGHTSITRGTPIASTMIESGNPSFQ